jgi:adenine/guanine phosphoribosyltransferase-like PRPP-binding protein
MNVEDKLASLLPSWTPLWVGIGAPILEKIANAAEPSAAEPVVKHGCEYLAQAFEPERLIDAAKLILGDVDFDTVVGTGLSGTIGATLIAYALKKHLLIVRKPSDAETMPRGAWPNHSGFKTEGRMGRKWVFVDDLVSTGKTRDRVKQVVAEASAKFAHTPAYVGTYTYGEPLTPAQFRE